MATNSREALNWQTLSADDTNLPQSLRDAIAALTLAKEVMEGEVRKHKPAPAGKRWQFSYRYANPGVALSTISGGGHRYF